MNKEKIEKKGQGNKDRIVRYRCERPLIADFDNKAGEAGKNRSQVLRELMADFVQDQERKRA